jgi:uracil-DNA glycosylase
MQSPLTQISPDWRGALENETEKTYFQKLSLFLKTQKSAGQTVYPEEGDIYNALKLTPLSRVKIVILGQDPYHGAGQAHGLAFSVREGVKLPPSLKNIYKEIESEYGRKMPATGDLTGWAEQGVLLLNATLTVLEGAAGSHQKQGWEQFTDAIVHKVAALEKPVVFMLWGSHAQKKASFVDREKHLVLETVHPSPLSAHRGFFGCGHFKKANDYLEANGVEPVDWYVL